MNDNQISVVQIASDLGKNKQYLFKVLNRLGIERQLIKNSESRGQKIAYISSDDYDRLKQYLAENDSSSSSDSIDSDVGGVFYLIQLEPEHDPGRFKLGFASSIEERLRSHRTAAPFSKVHKTWPCKLLWEKTAIECASQSCERLHTEVFRTDSIEEVEARCDQFFALMPEINET